MLHTYVMLPFIGPPWVEILADAPDDFASFDPRTTLAGLATEWHAAGNAIRCRGTTSAKAREKQRVLDVAQLMYKAVDDLAERVTMERPDKAVVRLGNMGSR